MPGNPTNDPRRRSPRHTPDDILNDVGDVIDLSARGMRIRCRGRALQVGDVTTFKLSFREGSMRLRGRVVWRQRQGFFGWELGVNFLNVNPRQRHALASLAEFGFIMSGSRRANSKRADDAQASTTPTLRVAFESPDYYALLGVSKDADPETIKREYRRCAIRIHPDRNPAPDAAAQFAALTVAYEVLIDPEQRALYDLGRAA